MTNKAYEYAQGMHDLHVSRDLIQQVNGILELIQAVVDLKDPHMKLLIMGSANFGKWAFSHYENKVKKLAEQHKDRIIFFLQDIYSANSSSGESFFA